MIPKIGVSKCPYKKVKFFNVSTPCNKVYIDKIHPPIGNIVSFMVSCTINKINISKEKIYEVSNNINSKYSFVTIFLELTYKIIYSSSEKKSLHIFNYKTYTMTEIKMPSFLDGSSIEQLFNSNKLKVETFIENVDIELYDQRLIIVNPYILSNILISSDYSIAYVLELSTGDKNIYISYSDGSKLLQKTFSKNSSYKRITWCPFSNEISYLCNERGTFELYTLNVNNRSIPNIYSSPSNERSISEIYTLNVNNRSIPRIYTGLSNVTDFTYISSDLIVLCSEKNNLGELFLLNTRSNSLSKLINILEGQSFTSPKYSKALDKILFINRTADSNHICSIETNSLNLNYIMEQNSILQYDINTQGNMLLLLSKQDNDAEKPRLYEINTKILKDIFLLDIAYTIKGMCFVPFKDEVAFCLNFDDKDDILLYNYTLDTVKNLTNHSNKISISDFSFNFLGDTLFYSSNERGHYDVYSLAIEDTNKNTLINCGCNNISLYYKGL